MKLSLLRRSGLLCSTLSIFVSFVFLAGAAQGYSPVPPEFAGLTFYPNSVPAGFNGKIGTMGKMPGTRWAYIQPTSRTAFNWGPIDTQVANMTQLGVSNFVYAIENPPGWAVANHSAGTGRINAITGQWESYLAPDNMADYTNFITALLTRYPQINVLVPFVEPANLPMSISGAIAMNTALINHVHTNFPGVKVGSPTVQVSAFPYASGNWYYDYWAQGGPTDFDILMYHGYPGMASGTNNVETVITRRALMTTFFNNLGFGSKPTWDEESSFGADATVAGIGTDTVAFVSQDLLMHASFGDSCFVWYGAQSLGWGTLSSGGVLNAAGNSWLNTLDWMLGSTLTAPIGLNGVVRSGVWMLPDGYNKAISVWTTDGSTPMFTVPLNYPPYTQYRDTAGNVTPITGGQVPIGRRPIWIETSAPAETIFTTQVPNSTGSLGLELGTKFKPLVNGSITAVSIYADATEQTGIHQVRIWSSLGALLSGPHNWSITGGSAGWKSFTLPTPLSVTANVYYVVAVSASPGTSNKYARRAALFNAPINNGNLRADIQAGVYNTAAGGFPSTVENSSCYFRDVTFLASGTTSSPVINSSATASGTMNAAFSYQITATNSPTSYDVPVGKPSWMTVNTTTGALSGTPTTSGTFAMTLSASNASGTGTQSLTVTVSQNLFTTQVPSGAASLGLELGTKFKPLVNGTITGVRIYASALEQTGTHQVRIWSAAGALLSGPHSWSITGGTAGWKTFTLPTALSVTASSYYVVSVSASPGASNKYARTAALFNAPITNGNLRADTMAGVYSTTAGGFPNTVENSSCYFRDVIFNP